ncbi:Immunoglobulin heavy constant alpha 2, partial [Anabarilius grahami]
VFRAVEGATVHLPCHSPPDDSVQVSVKWTKNSATSKNICEWTGSSSSNCIPRFTLNRTSFTLSIENVQPSDSGNYSCKTTRLIPPPTFDNVSNVILHVEGLSLQLLNSSNDTCVHLLCSLEGLNPELVNFTWSREGQRLLHPSTSYDMKSELHLCKPDCSDGDKISCHASFSSAKIPLSRNITLDFSNEESSQDFSVVFVAFFSIFIIAIGFIWILFWVLKYAESIRAVEGATVHLPCHSPPDDSELFSVEWTKKCATSKTICKWNINKITESSAGGCIPHFTFNRKSLSIENVQLSDSGNYSCKTTRLIPPPTLDNISNVILQVTAHPGLSLQLLNSSDDTCIHLLCSLEGLNPELVNFTWSREGQRSLHPSTSYDMKSELHLCKPDWSDGDTITCHASYSSNQTPLSRNITLDFSNEGQPEIHLPESSQKSPEFCVVLFGTFIICIVFIWMFFCFSNYAESIRAVEGATVHLPCHSPPDDSVQVSVKWTKNSATSKTICELNIYKETGSSSSDCIPRFTLNRTSFTLSIENVQPSDSGNYSCKTTRLIPPPLQDNISNLRLHVADPVLSLQLLNSSDDTCIHLLCSLEGLNPELVNFTWSREDQRSLHPSTSYAMNSELHLCKPDWSDGDTITCHASYSSIQTPLSRNITLDFSNEAHPGLSLQLLNSSNDTCVHLLCSLESLNPELVNFTWSREGQRSLHPSTSYDMKSELHLCKPDWSDGDTITCHAYYSNSQTQTSIPLTSQHASDKESIQNFPAVFVAIFSIFICIVFI